MTQQIRYAELVDAGEAAHGLSTVHTVLSLIPERGCRLFAQMNDQFVPVVLDDGTPKFFDSIEEGVTELALLPGIDNLVTVDILSLIPRASARLYGFAGAKTAAYHIGNLQSDSTQQKRP